MFNEENCLLICYLGNSIIERHDLFPRSLAHLQFGIQSHPSPVHKEIRCCLIPFANKSSTKQSVRFRQESKDSFPITPIDHREHLLVDEVTEIMWVRNVPIQTSDSTN